MRSVPAGFNPYSDCRYTDCEIKISLVSDNVADVENSVDGDLFSAISIDDPTEMLSSEAGFGSLWATTELDMMTGANNYTLFDGEKKGVWWDACSNSSCEIPKDGSNNYPTVTFEFSNPRSAAGVTLCFDTRAGTYVTDMRMKVTNDDGEVFYQNFTGDGTEFGLVYPIIDAVRVDIELKKTDKPGRIPRISATKVGFCEYYNSSRLIKWSYRDAIDLTSDSLPSAAMNAEVIDGDRYYSLADPKFLEYMIPGMSITAVVIVDGTRVEMPTMYLDSFEPSGKDGTIKIVAYDAAYDMDDVYYQFHNDDDDPDYRTEEQGIPMDMLLEKVFSGDRFDYENLSSHGSTLLCSMKHHSLNYRDWATGIAQATKSLLKISQDKVTFFDENYDSDPVDELDKSKYSLNQISMPIMRTNAIRMEAGRNDSIGWPIYVEIDRPLKDGESRVTKTYTNTCVYNWIDDDGDGRTGLLGVVGEWVLSQLEKRIERQLTYRGNPAIEIGDMVLINEKKAIVTEHELAFDGYLYGKISVVEVV